MPTTPTIAIVTVYTNWAAEYGLLTAANKRRYCERHGYLFKGFTKTDPTLPRANWGKYQSIVDTFLEHPTIKWAFWSDADAIINQPDVRLESFLDEDFDMLISNDIFGIHSGHFFMRNCQWTFDFINLLPTAYQENHDRHTDQPAVQRLLHNYEGMLDRVKNCGDLFNRFNSQPRGFTIHFADYPQASRLQVITEALGNVAT